MHDADELIRAVRAALDETERIARAAQRGDGHWEYRDMRERDPDVYPWQVYAPDARLAAGTGFAPQEARHIAHHDPARVLAEVDAKRRILDEHAPQWQTVEWPHDQNGKGEAQVCRRCQNAEHTEWHPAPGEAGVLPEGFVAPYVLAPCLTLRLLAGPDIATSGGRDSAP